MVILGYRGDTNELLLRNSWGTSWGDNGHAWIPFAFLADHVIAAWTIATSVTQPPPGEQPELAARFGTHDEH